MTRDVLVQCCSLIIAALCDAWSSPKKKDPANESASKSVCELDSFVLGAKKCFSMNIQKRAQDTTDAAASQCRTS